MLLYRGDKVIAGSINNQDDTLVRLIDMSDTSELGIPWDLFGPPQSRRTEVKLSHVRDRWIKNRTVPENRLNIKDILVSLGLSSYVFLNVVRLTKAREPNDTFWVDWDGVLNE